MNEKLQQLGTLLQGELYFDNTMRLLYATDASAYREMPLAVAIPKTVDDIKQLIAFASDRFDSNIRNAIATSVDVEMLQSRRDACDLS